jgi:hypothetical protein
MDNYIKDIEDVELSGQDLKRMTGLNNITAYHDLHKFTNIDQLMGNSDAVIILYEMKENYGHWVLLFKTGNKQLQFFDPYGLKIDEELKFAQYNLRLHNGQITPHLTSIIKNSDYTVHSNTTKYQQWKAHTNTCGRHVAVRYLYKNLNHDDYKKLMTKQKLKPDEYVALMTMLL